MTAGTGSESWCLVGATGRVGRMLARAWAARPPAGAGITLQSREAAPGHLHWPLDAPAPARFDVMIVMAGAVPGRAPVERNAAIARAALRAASASGARRVLLASSAAVYGPGRDLSEDAPCRPATDYGRAKRAMERVAAAAPVETCCLRIGNVAGADALLGRLAPRSARRLDRFADGRGPLRSYIGPATLAAVLETLAAHPGRLPAVLNVAAPAPVAMDALLRAAGARWTWTAAPDGAVQAVTLDCARLAALHRFAQPVPAAACAVSGPPGPDAAGADAAAMQDVRAAALVAEWRSFGGPA